MLRCTSLACCTLLALFAGAAHGQEKPTVGAWMSPGGPWGIWEKSVGDAFPVQRIVNDLADLGVSDILFFEQSGRGGPFLHPTAVPHAATERRMKDRDFLEELLLQTDPRGMKVWLAWTPPGGKYPGTEFAGLNHPEILKLYAAEIEEVAARYGKHPALAGIMWHEVDCSEAPDLHDDDLPEFSDYCRRTFGESYPAKTMPQVDAADKWWRRFFLYRCDVVNRFVAHATEICRRYKLQTVFCSYVPESFPGDSWRWGYDIVALEEICDRQWFSGYGRESGKPYQTIRGAWIDFGPSYKGQILARNFSYAFHGRPLCYFVYRSPVYIEETRNYYAKIKGFTEKYGDIYTGFSGLSPKEVELFFGKQNMQRWLGLMTAWQGATSPAQIAVAVNPNSFVMQHPQGTGVEYEKQVRALMVGLTESMDVDGLVLGSRFALDPKNLAPYSLIVIPGDMGRGLSVEMAESLRQYVAHGGKLLLVAGRLTTAKPDLTDEKDLTEEFAGLKVTGPGLPGYLAPAKTAFLPKTKKFWVSGRQACTATQAKVLVAGQDGAGPLLLGNRQVFFSTISSSPDAAEYFAAVVRHIAQPAVTLDADCQMRILETAAKGQAVSVALWGQGKATLRLDTAHLPLPAADRYQLKDIVTGQVLGDFPPAKLAAGVPVEVKHLYQPMILAVGTPAALAGFRGIYPNADAFAGMTLKQDKDNPEVPEEAGATVAQTEQAVGGPSRPRDRAIALLDHAARFETSNKRSTLASRDACMKVLRSLNLEPELVDVDIFLPQNKARRDAFKRIVIPSGADYYSQAMFEGIDDYVRSGGLLISNSSAVLVDRNANYKADEEDSAGDYAKTHFLGVHGHASATMPQIKVLQACPLTEGLKLGEWIVLAPATAGRDTRNHSAEILVTATRTKKDRPAGEQPFLTYKHQGRGASIYLVGQISDKGDERIRQILRNCCSEKTLRWLCQ